MSVALKRKHCTYLSKLISSYHAMAELTFEEPTGPVALLARGCIYLSLEDYETKIVTYMLNMIMNEKKMTASFISTSS